MSSGMLCSKRPPVHSPANPSWIWHCFCFTVCLVILWKCSWGFEVYTLTHIKDFYASLCWWCFCYSVQTWKGMCDSDPQGTPGEECYPSLQAAGGILQMFPGTCYRGLCASIFQLRKVNKLTRYQPGSTRTWNSSLGQCNFQMPWAWVSPTRNVIHASGREHQLRSRYTRTSNLWGNLSF